MTLATHEEVIEPEIVRDASEWVEVIKDDLGRAVEGIVSAGKHLIAAKADVSHGEWLPMLKEIGISARGAQRLMSIGSNSALSNATNSSHLPKALDAIYELSRLGPSEVEDGIREGAITPDMTIRDAKAFARSDWPVVPEPTPEEQLRKFEETRERLIEQGVLPKPRTQEEEDRAADEFVESLVGSRRSTPSETDPRIRQLNAVGELLASNEPINTNGLTANGLRAAQLLGLV